jgi:hypothetical protein
METTTNDVEDTIQRLCEGVDGERDLRKQRELRSRLGAFLHENAFVLTSMSELTYQALRKIKGRSARHRVPGVSGKKDVDQLHASEQKCRAADACRFRAERQSE